MKSALAYLAGFVAFFALAVLFLWSAFNALDAEADSRAARQLQQDKRLLLKAPAMHKIKGRTVEDCQIIGDELHCLYTDKRGELGRMAAK